MSNKERDELVQIIREGWPAHGSTNYPARGGFAEVPPVRDGGMTARVIDFAVDTVLANIKPRTITKTEELKTVYAGCLIRESNGDLWSIEPSTERLFMLADGMDDTYDDDALTLPAVVLYEGTA